MSKDTYSKGFYDTQQQNSRVSARIFVPFLVDALRPNSVLDVGCGVGTWCSAFREAGVGQVHGVDGPWVEADRLEIPPDTFFRFDFGSATPPFDIVGLADRYDLVVTFEFLEHMPPERAEALVDYLTSKSDVVIAGGAAPGQGGVHHVNEQWPSYWQKLFEQRGFKPFDFVRPRFWAAADVEPWYAQNSIAYFRGEPPESVVKAAEAAAVAALRKPPALVHPGVLNIHVQALPASFGAVVRHTLRVLMGRHKAAGDPPALE